MVEALLAGSIFGLLVTALTGAYLYGQEGVVLAGNRARAVLLAEEGLEATRNIRDASFANLADGTHGLSTAGSVWAFSGSSDATDLFTRQVTVAPVDSNRKSVTSTVSWNQNGQRVGSVSLVEYLTYWQRVVSLAGGGILAYGDATILPKYRTFDNAANAFGAEASTSSSDVASSSVIRTSPKATEAIAGFVSSTGVLNVMCYDGNAWVLEWAASLGGTAADRRFDIAYETSSGDAMVLYGRNVAATNELAYRTKAGGTGCGSGNWSGASSFDPVRTSGAIRYVKLAWDRRASQNILAAAWIDGNDDLSAAVWSGTAWGNEPATVSDANVERIATSHDIENFDLEYETLTGDLMAVWGTTVAAGANGVRYRACTGGTSSCVWAAVATPPTFADNATSLDLAANPNTDEMVFASVGNRQNDLQIGYWSGTAWTNTANVDTSCNPVVAGAKQVAVGWLVSGVNARSVVTYGDQGSNRIDWYAGNLGVFAFQADIVPNPSSANPYRWIDVQVNPTTKDSLAYCFADASNDLYCKRLEMSAAAAFTWTDSGAVALQTALPQTIASPFSFAYWRN